MNLDLEALTDEDVLSVIRRSQVFAKPTALHLQRLPSKLNRADGRHRLRFRVWQGDTPAAHLVVGRNLAELHRQTEAFSRANPDIALRPLFLVRHAGASFLAQEFGGLLNLEEALNQGRISSGEWQQAVRHVANRLRATTENSTPSALLRELGQLEEAVLALPALSRLDTIFLRDTVFPYLRLEAAKTAPAVVWTNGDFIAPNIVPDAEGRPRLVDYEFCRRTHFPDLDWFRLLRLSPRPDVLDTAALGAPSPFPAWLEVLGWLDHAVKTTAVCEPMIAQQDLQIVMTRVALGLRRQGLVKRAGLFFDFPADPAAAPAAAEPAEPGAPLALEWARDGSPHFTTEAPISLRASGWTELAMALTGPSGRFPHLRLRLPDTPCVLELRQLELFGRKREDVVWALGGEELRQLVACSGAALTVPTPDGVALIHFGGEAVVTLPRSRLARRNTASGVVIRARFVPDLQEFAQRLQEISRTEEIGARLLPPPVTAIEGGPSRAAVAQLFVPDGPAYSETRSVRVPLQNPGMWEEVSFDIPPLPAGAVLRFDPVDQPGLIELGEILLTPAPSTLPGEIRSAPIPFSVDTLQCEGEAIRLAADSSVVRLFAFGRDPIAKLPPLPSTLANRPARFMANLRWAANPALLAAAGVVRDLRQEMSQLHLRLRAAAEQLEAALRESRERASAESLQRGRAEEQYRELQALNGTQARDLEAGRRALQQAQEEQAVLQQAIAGLHQEQAAAKKELARLREELAARDTEFISLQRQAHELTARTADAAERETSLQQSIAAEQTRRAATEDEAHTWRDRAATLDVALAEARERLAAGETRITELQHAIQAAQAAQSLSDAEAAHKLRAASEELARERGAGAEAARTVGTVRQELAARDALVEQLRRESEAARQEAAQLRQTLATANNDRLSAWKENERLCTAVANQQVIAEASQAAARQRELEFMARLERTAGELRALQDALAARQVAERGSAEALRASEDRAARLDSELQSVRAALRGLEAATQEQEALLARLRRTVEDAEVEQTRLKAVVASREEEITTATAERTATRTLLQERAAALAALRQENDVFRTRLKNEVAAGTVERATARAMLDERTAAVAALRQEGDVLRTRLKSESVAHGEHLAAIDEELRFTVGERNELAALRHHLEADVAASHNRIGELEQMAAGANETLGHLRLALAARETALETLQRALEESRAAGAQLEVESLELAQKLEAEESAHLDLRTRFGSLVESCHAQNEQLQQFERNMRLLLDEATNVETQFAAAEARNRILCTAIESVSKRTLVKMDRTALGLLQQAVQETPSVPPSPQ